MKTYFWALLAFFLIAACNPSRDQGQNKIGGTAWQGTYDSLATQYQVMQTAYIQDSTRFSPDFRMMYHQMQQQWQQMQSFHRQMTGGNMMGNGGMMRGNGGMMRGRGMQGSGSPMGGGMMIRFREMNQQMLSYCTGLRQSIGSGNGMGAMLDRMQQFQQHLLNQLPKDTSAVGSTAKSTASSLNGAALFTNNCSACHGANAEGMSGIFPPLNGTPVTKGDKTILLKVVLRGMQGPDPVNGITYNGTMPSFGSTLSNDEVAAVLTYIRSLPKNDASAVTTNEVVNVNQATKGHTNAYTAHELGLK